MKQPILLTFICFLAALQLGHTQKVPKNYLNINAGIGLLPTFLKDGSKANVHPLLFSADYKLSNNFTLGMSAGHSVSRTDEIEMKDGSKAQWLHHFTAFGLRTGAYSNLIADHWHFYGGLLIGCSLSEIDMLKGEEIKVRQQMGMQHSNTKMFYTAYLGTRYSITPHLGVFSEVSLGVSLLSVGVSVSVW